MGFVQGERARPVLRAMGRARVQRRMGMAGRRLRIAALVAAMGVAGMGGLDGAGGGAVAAERAGAGKAEMAKVSKAPKDRRGGEGSAQGGQPAAAAAAGAGAAQGKEAGAVSFSAAAFKDLPGWETDDHLAALKAFCRSCGRVMAAVRAGARSGDTAPSPGLLSACEDAAALMAGKATRAAARAFFESHFLPHRVVHEGADGLLTGYYEPVIEGSRTRDKTFRAAVLKRPADLVNLVAESERGAKAEQLTHARRTAKGTEPYPTRQEIDEGALAGQKLELLYLKDAVDLFFMQVQGSGRIALPDGSSVRVTYDGKNGHPYTSIGRYLIDKGWFDANRMSLQALKDWLKKNPDRMQEVLWQNRSYVFFRELAGEQANGPMGVLEIPLSPGRSLAVDTRYHAIGTPVYVAAPDITHMSDDKRPFQRLMIAQDVGSAIRGPERGDIYVGSGDGAGRRAGITKHRGNFFVLLPREALRGPVRDNEPVIEVRGKRRGGPIRQAQQ